MADPPYKIGKSIDYVLPDEFIRCDDLLRPSPLTTDPPWGLRENQHFPAKFERNKNVLKMQWHGDIITLGPVTDVEQGMSWSDGRRDVTITGRFQGHAYEEPVYPGAIRALLKEACGRGEITLMMDDANGPRLSGIFGVLAHHIEQTAFVLSLRPLMDIKPKKATKMSKIDNLAIIANDDVTTIKASFSWSNADGKVFTFKAMRAFASTLAVGDSVVVDSKNGLSAAKVISIDEFSDVEPDSDIEWRWAFQKIDTSVLDGLNKTENELIAKLKEAQRRTIQKSAMNALGIDADQLKALSSAAAADDAPKAG